MLRPPVPTTESKNIETSTSTKLHSVQFLSSLLQTEQLDLASCLLMNTVTGLCDLLYSYLPTWHT